MNVTNITNFVVRTDTLNSYMSEINKIPTLTPQEERDLFAKYESCKNDVQLCQDIMSTFKENDKLSEYKNRLAAAEKQMVDIRNEIIARNLRFNFAVAKRYSTGDMLPDLINVGTLGMYDAFDKYDWRTENRFCSFAVWFIRRAIYAHLNKDALMVRPKNNVRIAPKVKKIENDFFLKNGRRPYPIEVIDILRRDYGIDVKDEMDIYGARVDRLDSFVGDDDDFTLEDSADFNERTAVDNEFDSKSDAAEISYQIDNMMKALTEREQKIVSMAFGIGYNREYKDKEIGAALGLTSERVRQLRHGALKKMRATHMSTAD